MEMNVCMDGERIYCIQGGASDKDHQKILLSLENTLQNRMLFGVGWGREQNMYKSGMCDWIGTFYFFNF